jgi:acyl carrier protein
MTDPTPVIFSILKSYMRDQSQTIMTWASLDELGVDHLDLPMICLDIEDAFAITFHFGDEPDDEMTVPGLIAGVALRLEAKAMRPKSVAPRAKSTWLSTGAERRR